MTNTSIERLQELLDNLLMLFQESLEYQQGPVVRAVFQEGVNGLKSLHKRLQLVVSKYVVAVVGLTNVGKSTLINALFGEDLAPIRNGPCTPVPFEFSYHDHFQIVVHHLDGLPRRTKCENFATIRERLHELADARAIDFNRPIERISVESPLDLLKDGLTIADTPGFGAAQVACGGVDHEQSLRHYLKNRTAQVLWVVLAEQGIGKSEKQIYDDLFADVCDDVVVTESEHWEPEDRQRFRRRFARCFRQRLPFFHFVCGLTAVESKRRGDVRGLAESGIDTLENRIRQLASGVGRSQMIQEDLTQLAGDLGLWLTEHRNDRSAAFPDCWRPDSWLRWVEVAKKDVMGGSLAALLND